MSTDHTTHVDQDQWGFFYNFTGHEAKGRCFWCGVDVKYGRYCCNEHKYEYTSHYMWFEASRRCWRESNGCADCGRQRESYKDRFAIHHIVPLNGDYRAWHYLNHPKNLVCLCGKCHMIRHKELNSLLKKASMCNDNTIHSKQLWLFNF